MAAFKFSWYQLLNYFITGFILVFSIYIFYYKIETLSEFNEKGKEWNLVTISILIIISLFIGLVINSFRNAILEKWVFLKFKKMEVINWDYFHEAPNQEIEKLIDSYYASYCFSLNTIISILLSLIFLIPNFFFVWYWVLIVSILISFILFKYALALRKQIIKAIKWWEGKQSIPAPQGVTQGTIIDTLNNVKKEISQAVADLNNINSKI